MGDGRCAPESSAHARAHGLWDFSVFTTGVGHAGDIAAIATVVNLVAGLLGLLCVVFVIRGTNEGTLASGPRTVRHAHKE